MTTSVSRETLDQLRIPSTATLTSVLRGLGITRSFMHRVRPLKPDMKMAGPAYTLRYIPAREDLDEGPLDNLKDKQRIGIEEIAEGEVLVIDARGDTRAGTMGTLVRQRSSILPPASTKRERQFTASTNGLLSGPFNRSSRIRAAAHGSSSSDLASTVRSVSGPWVPSTDLSSSGDRPRSPAHSRRRQGWSTPTGS